LPADRAYLIDVLEGRYGFRRTGWRRRPGSAQDARLIDGSSLRTATGRDAVAKTMKTNMNIGVRWRAMIPRFPNVYPIRSV
jgi:hypothetical protein